MTIHIIPTNASAVLPVVSRMAKCGRELDNVARDVVTRVSFSNHERGVIVLVSTIAVCFVSALFGQSATPLIKSGEVSPVSRIAVASDGKLLAIVQYDRVLLYDATNGRLLRSRGFQFEGETGYFVNDSLPPSIEFRPSGRTLVVAGKRGQIRLWSLSPEPTDALLKGHQTDVLCARFSPDGILLATGDSQHKTFLWDVSRQAVKWSVDDHNNSVGCLAFSPDGKLLASGSFDGAIKIRNAITGKELRCLDGHDGAVGAVVFSPDGRTLLSADEYGTTTIWNVESGRKTWEFMSTRVVHPSKAPNYVLAICMLRDNRTIITGSFSGTVCFWDIKRCERLKQVVAFSQQDAWGQALFSMTIFPKKDMLLCGGVNGEVRLIDVEKILGRQTTMARNHDTSQDSAIRLKATPLPGKAHDKGGRTGKQDRLPLFNASS